MFDAVALKQAKHLHFIGIGGSGMFPIVQILHARGYLITGSDNNESDIVTTEREMGIAVTLGQKAENIAGADMIVYTAAIMEDNPELMAARASGLPLAERAEVLGWLSQQYNACYCISGTHGKTTVTSMLTQIFMGADRDPSVVIGGKLAAIDGYGRAGEADLFVCEACEFQDHFLKLTPSVAVILNIDNDHMEYFGTMDNMIASFRTFAQSASKAVIYNGDDPNTCKAMQGVTGKPLISVGAGDNCLCRVSNLRVQDGVKSTFLLTMRGEPMGSFTLNVPGRHNALNAAVAIASALYAGVEADTIRTHLKAFCGVGRRFEILGKKNGVTIADDYAHHPAELAATLNAAKELHFGKVWAVFQPFTYSRTKLLMEDFAKSLSLADHVVMSEIMGSREKNDDGVFTSQLAEKIPGAVWYPEFPEIAAYVMDNAKAGDLVLTMGCGDIYKCARMMLAQP